jgi:hypothetical protein
VTELPSAPATERNREPILGELVRLFQRTQRVLEIGSGTGQHAVFFAPALPQLVWQTSERPVELAVLSRWLSAQPAANLPAPLALDVDSPWPELSVDGVFSANTAHIMSWRQVCVTVGGVSRCLAAGGRFVLYGPFAFQGQLVPSNARFHDNLRARRRSMGIRGREELEALAEGVGLVLGEVIPMPANNHLLVWDKR